MGAPSFSRRGLGALMVAWLAAASGVRAEEPPSPQEAEQQRLDRVRREIDRLKAALQEERQKESGLMGDLHRLDLELALHRGQIEILDAEIARCRSEIGGITAETAMLRGRLRRTGGVLAARLRALYVSGPLDFRRVVLTARNPAEISEAYGIASRLSEMDGRRVHSFRTDLARLRDDLERLELRQASLRTYRSQELAQRRELEGIRSDRSHLLGGLRRQAEGQKEALQEMLATERDLQRLVQTLATGGIVPPDWKVGFERFRGLLPWPVSGKVLVPFGARKSTKFDTLVPHPGLDLAVALGEPVRAVFDGMVAFSDWFKGYGNLVVLEHAGGFMTVYAHASERLVGRGDRVLAGQVIARGGDTGSLEGLKLYFEIWRDGKPEDPIPWLTQRNVK
jgi:septal ring factor EnvC (AmiA/AmiB activator)